MNPSSRLALFSEKFIQACWLLALVAAPVFFNIYSSRVFEPDKIALIRTLALAMGVTWLILRAERWRGQKGARKNDAPLAERVKGWVKQASAENPLTLPALFLLLAYVISTIVSLSPTVSFFGSYQRLQGLYTFSAYLVIFLLAASQIKTRADIERAISIALIASFPVALYGIIQHYFVDPLPWVGDVTTRVASNLGNSIFIGSFLILAIPLALGRLIQSGGAAAANLSTRGRIGIYVAAFISLVVIAGAWALAFESGAKPIIEANYAGVLTPDQLALTAGAFNLALAITFLIFVLWGVAAVFIKGRTVPFFLIAIYASLLAVQIDALLFSQSRGPQIAFVGGLFTFGVLYAFVRGGRRLIVGVLSLGALLVLIQVILAALLILLVAVINIPNSPLSSLRDLPYVGRLGRVFELEGGTGRVRVLIWQGALQLVEPHEPLSSPLTGADPFNVIRPLIGYGPETMYVAYNKFYPPELGTLESRNATPDRSHNETFDALVTTGLFGFIAENVLFLTVFYFALKWLGLMPSRRARNLFIAAWYGGGILMAVLFGFAFGWEFIGVALPGGMIVGMFAYLFALALRKPEPAAGQEPGSQANALWVVAIVALFVSHFIEIHFGIAIVATRLYFWFFAAVLIGIGARKIRMEDALPETAAVPIREVKATNEMPAPRKKRVPAQTPNAVTQRKEASGARRVSTAPLITYAFLVGFVLAVMGFDYINTNNLGSSAGQNVSGLTIVISALTLKNTTAGLMPSFAMLWLFVTTLLLGLGICVGDWGRGLRLERRDWVVAIFLFLVLAFAIFSGLVFYHVILIAAPGASILDSLLSAVSLFTIFMLIVGAVSAGTMMFDENMPLTWVSRTTNWVVAPVLAIIAGILISATNVDPIRADILYKQAASLTGQDNAQSIQKFQEALALQPQQDYYYLFLGRAYLDAAKQATDANERTATLAKAQTTLDQARAINPYNTDHSANLARLAQAKGALATDPKVQSDAYKQAAVYFQQATTLSPNTAHLYDQFAQALLEYEGVLKSNGDAAGAAAQHAQAEQQIATALKVDDTFCLTYAVRSQAQTDWLARTQDALKALELAPRCGDVFYSEGLSLAVNELAQATDEALAAKQGTNFEQMITAAAGTNPTLEIYTTLANFYSKEGRIPDALAAVDKAIALIPAGDTTTSQRYKDFRFTLVNLQNALDAANAAPNQPELQRAVAEQWLARGQFDFALPAYQKVLRLSPNDYSAQRNVILILIVTDQLDEAATDLKAIQAIAPQSDQVFWQKLSGVLDGIQKGNNQAAVALLDDLAKSADTKDYALVSALRKLAEKIKAAG